MNNTGVRSGIDFIGTCAWGTHMCLLYRTKEEFLDISVPFLKAGLENNELCIWLTGRDLPFHDTNRRLKKLIPQFDTFLQTGILEIHDGRAWYCKNNRVAPDSAIAYIRDALARSGAKGCAGVRVITEISWAKKSELSAIWEYENFLNRFLKENNPVVVLCAYAFQNRLPEHLIQILRNHLFILLKQQNGWQIQKNVEYERIISRLQKNAQFYDAVISAIPEIVYSLDSSGEFRFISDNVEQLTGFSPSEVYEGREDFWLSRIHPDDQSRISGLRDELMNQGKLFDAEYRIQSKDQRWLWIHDRVCRSETLEGNDFFYGIISDITGQKQIVDKLEFGVAFEKTINEIASRFIGTYNFDSAVNESLTAIGGFLSLDGTAIFMLEEQGAVMRIKNSWMNALMSSKRELFAEITAGHFPWWMSQIQKGEVFCFEGLDYLPAEASKEKEFLAKIGIKSILVIPIKINENISGFVVFSSLLEPHHWSDSEKILLKIVATIFMHAFRRKETEEALQESETKFKAIFDSAADAMFIKNRGCKYVVVNCAMERLFGLPRPNFIGKTDAELFSDPAISRIHEIDLQVLHGEIVKVEQNRVINGLDFTFDIIKVPLKNPQGEIIGLFGVARDITERKRFENQIRDLARFPADNPSPIIRVTKEGALLYANNAGLSFLHNVGSKGVMLPQEWITIVKDVYSKGVKKQIEVEVNKRKFTFDLVPLHEQNYVNFYGLDITELKKAEEDLRGANQTLRDIIEFLPDATFVISAERKVIAWNKAIEDLTGTSQEDILGKGDFAYALPFYKVRRPILIDFLFDNLMMESEYSFLKREGHCVYAETFIPDFLNGRGLYLWGKASLIFDAHGNMVGAIESIRDITERKKIEKILEDTQNRQKAILDNIPDMAWLKDREGRFIAVNGAFARSCGIKAGEMSGKTDFDVWPRDLAEKYRNDDREVIESGKRKYVEEPLADKEGKIQWLETIKIPIYNDENEVIGTTGIARDITERKKYEEELKDAYRRLKETQEELIQTSKMAAMGQLAAGISHELNQPLSGIKGFAQTALLDLPENSQIRDDINRIIEQADRMDKIIKNVRFFSRKSDFVMEIVDIHKPLEDALLLLHEQLKIHDITIQEHFDTSIPGIYGDANQLQQVFINLINNAKDAIEATGRTEGRVIGIITRLNGDEKYIEISIHDQGCGIPQEHLAYLFNPFFTTKSPGGGMGLGLSIVYRIVENHNGKISVESESGKGTTFKIILPVPQEKLISSSPKE